MEDRNFLEKKLNRFENDGILTATHSQSATPSDTLVQIRLLSAANAAVSMTDKTRGYVQRGMAAGRQLRPRCGATLVERGRRWLAAARPPIGAFHLSTLMAAKVTNHVRRTNIIGQFVVVASASFVVSSGTRRSVGVRKCGLSARLSYS